MDGRVNAHILCIIYEMSKFFYLFKSEQNVTNTSNLTISIVLPGINCELIIAIKISYNAN